MAAFRVPLALVLLSTGLAGCTGILDAPDHSAEATAGDLVEVARGEASAWRSTARLTSAGTFEAKDLAAKMREANESFALPDDPIVGNGRGVAWGYEFVDPATGDELEIVIAAHNRSVLLRDEGKGRGNVSAPARLWGVDSGEAAARAYGNSTFARSVGAMEDPTFAMSFAAGGRPSKDDDGGPRWVFVAMAKDEVTLAVLNATTGEVLHAGNMSTFAPPFDMGGWGGLEPRNTLYEERESGRLTVLAPSAEHEFPVAKDGASARIELCNRGAPQTGRPTLEVLGPDGEPRPASETTPSELGATWFATDLEEGKYVAKVTLAAGGLTADYELDVAVWTGTSFDLGAWPTGC